MFVYVQCVGCCSSFGQNVPKGWQTVCHLFENVEFGAVQKCVNRVDLKRSAELQCKFTCIHRLQYSLERALQSYVIMF